MAFIKGKGLRIALDGDKLWHATSCGIDSTSKSDTVNSKDTSGDVVTISGYSYTLSMEGLYATLPDGTPDRVTADDLMILHQAGTMVPWQMVSDDSKYVYAGFAYVTQGGISAPTEGNATASFSFTGSGDYTITLVTP